ncbi:helix-turn-helix domain-containing protein [Paenibacillus tyrfis]|uniref:helix-turn-helix domain-containing protein n=1 Tax=Paenibacillus tyrfis TaxID=1501230 RepID=UPI0020A1B045|nr:helix-turn-helix transcriptional regulator [Paenibacillus tyrfis]MCP1306452.1 helix-turn-helix domain-containing protein [Paenibacillus tyrfis]
MTKSMGELIKERRLKLDLKQDELAAKVGINRNVLSSYESNRNIPPSIVLGKIADALKVSVDYLLGRTDDPYQIFINKEDDFSDQEQILLKKFMIETEELLRSKGDISEEKLSHVLEFMGWVFRKEAEEKNKSQS